MLAALALSALLFQVPPPLTVYVFTTTDCPISNRYAPEIQRLQSKYAGRVRFVLVYPVAGDAPEAIAAHKKKYGYSLETIRDTDLKLVKQTGVTVTPEVALMKGAQVLYRGRIDDRYVEFGKDRPQPATRDLEAALAAVVAGRPVAVKETRAIGCFLADLLK
jgi:thiol-disulfide isomerase/thioredoxin